jgi:hypothetical protein
MSMWCRPAVMECTMRWAYQVTRGPDRDVRGDPVDPSLWRPVNATAADMTAGTAGPRAHE